MKKKRLSRQEPTDIREALNHALGVLLGIYEAPPISPLPNRDTLDENPGYIDYLRNDLERMDLARKNRGQSIEINKQIPYPEWLANAPSSPPPPQAQVTIAPPSLPQQALNTVGQAFNQVVSNFTPTWNDFINMVKEEAVKRNYPVSVALGQAALESARGQSHYAKTRNNYYGYQAYDSNPDMAKVYKSPRESVADYITLIQTNPIYKNAWGQYQRDKNETNLVQNLHKAGYATDPNYAWKVTNTPEFKQYVGYKPPQTIAPRPQPTTMPQVSQDIVSPLPRGNKVSMNPKPSPVQKQVGLTNRRK